MKKKILIIIFILILVCISLILIILNQKNNNNYEEGKSDNIIVKNGKILKYPTNRSNFFAVKNIVSEYINLVIDEENIKLLNVLSSQYIKEEFISSSNIIEKVKENEIEYSSNYYIIIDKVYMIEESQAIQTYFIDLLYYNKDNNRKYKTKLIVQLDISNSTYQIIPYQFMKQKGYDKLKLGDSFSSEITKIEKNEYNKYNLAPISKNSMAERYFNLYLDYLQYDKEQSYYLLNEEYRNKRFGNINNYITYLNKIDIDNIMIDGYKINNYKEYTQFICIDNVGNYYIFNENEIMNFDIILDTYTIDLPEFIDKYNIATDQQKVALNIDKFFQAINTKDYRYAYNCLADSYKNNYFKTQEEFETYVKENFYETITVGYKEFNIQGEVYTYSVVLTNKATGDKMNKTFIMQLGEGTEFVLSFDK